MDFKRSTAFVLILSLLHLTLIGGFSLSARADITSSVTGEKFFIKVSRTTEGTNPDDTRIKFEECQTENPTACEQIGSRDYSIRELQEQRELLLTEAQKEGRMGFSGAVGRILGVIGGMGAVGVAGGEIAGAFAGDSDAAIGVVAVGMLAGIIVGAVAGGIIVSKIIRHHKKKKADKLNKEASTVEEQVIDGDPVSIQMDVDIFAKLLSDVLASLPPVTKGRGHLLVQDRVIAG